MNNVCEKCAMYIYDDEFDCYFCDARLDEDEMSRFISGKFKDCPYYRNGDEYAVVRKTDVISDLVLFII